MSSKSSRKQSTKKSGADSAKAEFASSGIAIQRDVVSPKCDKKEEKSVKEFINDKHPKSDDDEDVVEQLKAVAISPRDSESEEEPEQKTKSDKPIGYDDFFGPIPKDIPKKEQADEKKSVTEFDYQEIRNKDVGEIKKLDSEDILKILITRGRDAKNSALWSGAMRLLKQISCEFDPLEQRGAFRHDFHQRSYEPSYRGGSRGGYRGGRGRGYPRNYGDQQFGEGNQSYAGFPSGGTTPRDKQQDESAAPTFEFDESRTQQRSYMPRNYGERQLNRGYYGK